jgi:hypothetical protein
MLCTVAASHLPPRAVAITLPLRAAAIALSDFAPAAWASRMAGMTAAEQWQGRLRTAKLPYQSGDLKALWTMLQPRP